ncbi:MAG: hypothetical protein KME64_07710 [Scytonematopsis contorta HA4267-MV1]|jgi:hypothetical protein|nr:hypothetical protein [Scytonematopsis contorta HA4267-MV1]
MSYSRWDYIDNTNGCPGFFKKNAANIWKNKDSQNQIFYFQETSRTLEYIEIYDKTRNMHVRLEDSQMLWKLGDESSWHCHPTSNGHWSHSEEDFVVHRNIKKVRIVYLVPKNAQFSQEYCNSITDAIKYLQEWYAKQMSQEKTFELNDPIVEVLHTEHLADWYSQNINGEYKYCFWNNVLADAFTLTGAGFNDSENIWIFYIDAENASGQYGGAGTSGIAVLPQHDLQGLIGKSTEPISRWIGGLGHELGHAFGLEHPPGCDENQMLPEASCLMYLGYCKFPDTFLLPEDINILNQSPFFSIY